MIFFGHAANPLVLSVKFLHFLSGTTNFAGLRLARQKKHRFFSLLFGHICYNQKNYAKGEHMPSDKSISIPSIVFIGSEGAGKSALYRKMRDPNCDLESNSEKTSAYHFSMNWSDQGDTNQKSLQGFVVSGDYENLGYSSLYYNKAQCAVVVYDVADDSTLQQAKNWAHDFKSKAGTDVPIILVGNKTDKLYGTSSIGNPADNVPLGFPPVMCHRVVSALKGEGVEELRDLIHETAMKNYQPSAESSVTDRQLIDCYAQHAGFFSLTKFRVLHTLPPEKAAALIKEHANDHYGAGRAACDELKVRYNSTF